MIYEYCSRPVKLVTITKVSYNNIREQSERLDRPVREVKTEREDRQDRRVILEPVDNLEIKETRDWWEDKDHKDPKDHL